MARQWTRGPLARKWTRGNIVLAGLVAAAAVVPSWWLRGSKDLASEAASTSGAEVDETASTNGAEVDEAASTSGAEEPRRDVHRLEEQSMVKSTIRSATPNAQTPNGRL
jgi:hypothetical protein